MRELARLMEQGAVPMVSAAAGVYILRCLPQLLAPTGALGAALLLLLGAAGGVAALVVGTVRRSPALTALCLPAVALRARASGGGAALRLLALLGTAPSHPVLCAARRGCAAARARLAALLRT